MVYSGLDEQRKLVNDFDDQEASGRVARDLDLWDRRTAAAGIDFRVGAKGKRVGVERDGESATIGINVTDQGAHWMTRNVSPYRIGSAVTHSAWWFLASSLRREEDRIIAVPDPNVVINAVSLTLESLEVMAVACAATDQASAVKDLSRRTDVRMRTLTRYAEVPTGVSSPEGR